MERLHLFFKHDKEGPGIDKDAPPKKGLPLFFDIYRREWWSLVKLNMLFLLFCLPMITIGPALAAMTQITMTMVQDRNHDLWYDFKNAFRENFVQGLVAGLLISVMGTILSIAGYFYFLGAAQRMWMNILLFLTLFVSLLLMLACLYVYPQIVTVHLSIWRIFKNALILGLSCLKNSLPALLIMMVTGLIPFLFPAIVPLWIILYFANMSFIASFVTWPTIKKHIAIDHIPLEGELI